MDTFFLCLICMSLVLNAFTVSIKEYQNGINWFNASKLCGEEGLEYNISLLSNLEHLTNHSIWLGVAKYRELTPWMELLGCYRFNTSHVKTRNLSSTGYCQRECNVSPFFSYTESPGECRCLKTLTGSEKVNIANCSKNNNLLVYEKFNFKEATDNHANCISISDDNMLAPRMCDGSDDLAVVCDDGTKLDTATSSHANALQMCRMHGKNLVSPNYTNIPNNAISWTSVFREAVEVEYHNKTLGNNLPISCYSGRKKESISNSTFIEFEIFTNNCSTTLEWLVCRAGLPSETTFEQNKDEKHTSPKVHANSKCIENKINNPKNVSGALIGGIIGGVAIIVFVSLLLIWIRRRKSKPAKLKETSQHELNAEQSISIPQFSLVEEQIKSKPLYSAVPNDRKHERKGDSEYAIVKKENKPNRPCQEDTYAIATEEEYDKLNNFMARKKANDRNVYGITGQCAEDEYDTFGLKAIDINDLYDTNKSINRGTGDDTYDSTNTV